MPTGANARAPVFAAAANKKPLRKGGVWIRCGYSLPAVATTAVTAAATTATIAILGNVDFDGPTVELGSIEGCNGLVGRLVIFEGDEPEAARTARITIGDDFGFGDLAKLAEGFVQSRVVGVPAQTSDKQFLRHTLFSSP